VQRGEACVAAGHRAEPFEGILQGDGFMALSMTDRALAERIAPAGGRAGAFAQAGLVMLGIAILALSAKVQVPVWPSPVPVTMESFAVLALAAAYGPRLGLATILGYMALGAAGADVFAGSGSVHGLAYMMGSTGGYLLGFVLATAALGLAARAGWDRSVVKMAGAMLIGNALIYLPGVLWLKHIIVAGGLYHANQYGSVWDQTLAWGVTPYLIGDAMKLALAALLLPGLWKLVGRVRG
jgi:biotin transport system substrate-specific component